MKKLINSLLYYFGLASALISGLLWFSSAAVQRTIANSSLNIDDVILKQLVFFVNDTNVYAAEAMVAGGIAVIINKMLKD